MPVRTAPRMASQVFLLLRHLRHCVPSPVLVLYTSQNTLSIKDIQLQGKLLLSFCSIFSIHIHHQ